MAKQNRPPEGGVRIPLEVMEDFSAQLFECAGTTHEDAFLMSEMLVANDLRCVFSHGTQQIPDYVRKIVTGAVNPRPKLRDVSESAGCPGH